MFARVIAAGAILLLLVAAPLPASAATPSAADNPGPPTSPVRLVFIHHSTGGMWLAEDNGGLGHALMDNNYYVSATNYDWGPEHIGDHADHIGNYTDIVNWPEWFTGPQRDTIMTAVYNESGQNVGDYGAWSRLADTPAGPNRIIMFKSCFPNSNIDGDPTDPPASEPNEDLTVANAKAVYQNILEYFRTRQDKLFVVITAPPLVEGDTTAARAANARAFNNWLVTQWLAGYPYKNVAVFDYYNVLTSNGGSADTNDLGSATGNHHRWWNGAEQHIQTVNNNFARYPSGDSHPSTAGQTKATAEFVPMLNVFYHRWQDSLAQLRNRLYLPLMLRDYASTPSARLQPGQLTYAGAFRLPEGGDRPLTFAYGAAP